MALLTDIPTALVADDFPTMRRMVMASLPLGHTALRIRHLAFGIVMLLFRVAGA